MPVLRLERETEVQIVVIHSECLYKKTQWSLVSLQFHFSAEESGFIQNARTKPYVENCRELKFQYQYVEQSIFRQT